MVEGKVKRGNDDRECEVSGRGRESAVINTNREKECMTLKEDSKG